MRALRVCAWARNYIRRCPRGLRTARQQPIPVVICFRLAGKRLGLLVGITRIVNGLKDDDHAKSQVAKRPMGTSSVLSF
jgi:hypothetical protein